MKQIALLTLLLTMNCRVLIPKEHQESTAIWSGDTQLVEALSRYKARLSWNPLRQEPVVGPAMTELLVYSMQPGSLSLSEGRSIGRSPGRILPSGLAVSASSVYYLVEEDGLRTLYVVDLRGGIPQSVLSGDILAVTTSKHALAVFGLLSGRSVVWLVGLDEAGKIKGPLEGALEIPQSQSLPLFRWVKDELYVQSGGSVYLFDADGFRGAASSFPACYYAVDATRGLSPDGRLFARNVDGDATITQSEVFRPNDRLTTKLGDDKGC